VCVGSGVLGGVIRKIASERKRESGERSGRKREKEIMRGGVMPGTPRLSVALGKRLPQHTRTLHLAPR